MTISPWWVSYAVILVGLALWIESLLSDAKDRDDATTERERGE